MTTKSAFTDEEWSALSETPGIVALAVAKAGDSGFLGGLRELRAIVRLLKNAEKDHANNELITSLLDGFDSNPDVETDEPAKMADEAVASCALANQALQKATDTEAEEYRNWVLEIAKEIAEAAKEDGVRVSPNESALIERLQAELTK